MIYRFATKNLLAQALIPNNHSIVGACSLGHVDGFYYLETDLKLDLEQVDVCSVESWTTYESLYEVLDLTQDWKEGTTALFVVAKDKALNHMSNLLRLRARNLKIAMDDQYAYIEATSPPFHLIIEALDETAVYQQQSSNFWVRYGTKFPIDIPSKSILFADRTKNGTQFTSVKNLEFKTVNLTPQITITSKPENLPQEITTQRIPIHWYFTKTTTPGPNLWILNNITDLQIILQQLPEEIVSLLQCCVLKTGSVIIWNNSKKSIELDIRGTAYYEHSLIPTLWIPVGKTLEPQYNKTKLTNKLNIPKGFFQYITPDFNGGYIEIADFAAMKDFVEYPIEQFKEVIAWEANQCWAYPQVKVEVIEPARLKNAITYERSNNSIETSVNTIKAPVPKPVAEKLTEMPIDIVKPVEIVTNELKAKEKEFMASTCAIDSIERSILWFELGCLYNAIGKQKDAGLCWASACFIQADLASAWHEEISKSNTIALDTLETTPVTLNTIWYIVSGCLCEKIPLTDTIVQWMSDKEILMDFWSFWLWKEYVAKMRQDPLTLVRGRDTLVRYIVNGIAPEKNFPGFVRFSLGEEADIGQELDKLYQKFQTIKRKRMVTEPPNEQTQVGVNLIFAYAYAYLGIMDKANQLTSHTLSLEDPVFFHTIGLLKDRVMDLIQGKGITLGIPLKYRETLSSKLDQQTRYKIDLFRQSLFLLNGGEEINSLQNAAFIGKSQFRQDIETIRSKSTATIYTACAQWIPNLTLMELRERTSLILDLVLLIVEPKMVAELCSLMLSKVITLPAKEQVIYLARILEILISNNQNTDACVKHILHVLPTIVPVQLIATRRILLSLKKLNLDTEAKTLVSNLNFKTFQIDELAVAGIRFIVGETEAPVIASTMKSLEAPDLNIKNRLKSIKGVLNAVVETNSEAVYKSLEILIEQLGHMTDASVTNSHMNLSVLQFAETIVLAIANDKLHISTAGQNYIDETEHMLRKRMHKMTSGIE